MLWSMILIINLSEYDFLIFFSNEIAYPQLLNSNLICLLLIGL